MRRTGIILLTFLLVAGAVAASTVYRNGLRRQMQDAIDRSQSDSPATIERLVKRGADIRTLGNTGATVATVAAFWNDPSLLKESLAGGVDPNAQDSEYGNTALINAMFAPNSELARILLKAGADVNHQTKTGDTALMCAVRNAQLEIIPILLDAGAKVDSHNAKGETALSLAKALQPGGAHPMRPDLSSQDFVRLLQSRARLPATTYKPQV